MNRYTVTITVKDNTTGNHGTSVLHSDKPESFNETGKLIQAKCQLINLSPEELLDVQRMMQELINKKSSN